MSHWRQQQQQDKFFRKAKTDGYRARSAYKLLQLQERFHLIRRGDVVVDLGAAPGSWSQVAAELVGPQGRVVALDLEEMVPIPGVVALQGDMTDLEVQDLLIETLGGAADVVLSDAAPATTGIKLRDHVLSMELVRAALAVAHEVLRPGGHFVAKAFPGEDFAGVLHEIKQAFRHVKVAKPEASRKESWERFVVARHHKTGTR
ncbi:MAG: RlmE family RNA methyltransferase [Anaerolineae bacterium]